MKLLSRFALIVLTLVALSTGVSCGKKDTTCTAFIKVIRTNGSAVSGAKVRLTSNAGLATSKELADLVTRTIEGANMSTDDYTQALTTASIASKNFKIASKIRKTDTT